MEVPILVLQALVAVSLPFGVVWLTKRVENAARGAVDESVGKALADYRYPLDKQLEEHRSALSLRLDRFSRDYSLYAEKRNTAYIEIFGLFARAHGEFSRHYNWLTQSRDFSRSSEPTLRQVADALENISEDERAALRGLIDKRQLKDAGILATQLYERDGLRSATKAFYAFRNSVVLHSILLSQEVDGLCEVALHSLAPLSVYADEHAEDGNVDRSAARKALKEVDELAIRLRNLLKKELQATS